MTTNPMPLDSSPDSRRPAPAPTPGFAWTNPWRRLREGGFSRRLRAGGFSTTEMLIVVALIGIMVLFTTPALIEFFRSMKVRTAAQRVVSHIRLCRQVAVSRRAHVTMLLQSGPGTSRYRAWEDTTLDNTHDANGADDTLGTDDDEPWVVRPTEQLNTDDVVLVDVYNDLTPGSADDEFATSADSVLLGDGTLMLRFYPDGQVKRLDDVGEPVDGDTLLRIRMDGQVGPDRLDRWYASVNRPGKVQTDFIRNPGWS